MQESVNTSFLSEPIKITYTDLSRFWREKTNCRLGGEYLSVTQTAFNML